jgi:hypothetical protein
MSTDDPDDPEDELLDSLAAFDEAEPGGLFNALSEAGVFLPPPKELDDAQLTSKLWEVINALAALGVFLHSTNHLSDRELYVELWEEHLREPAIIMPGRKDYAYHIDLLGSGSEEDMYLIHKYYADEDERRKWLEEWPNDVMPEHEDPPFDRDRLLPQAEDRTDEPVM